MIVLIVRITADTVLENLLSVRSRRTEAFEDRLGTFQDQTENLLR